MGLRWMVLRAHAIDAVMHFASFIQVGESVQDPGKYYRNNLGGTLQLLDGMLRPASVVSFSPTPRSRRASIRTDRRGASQRPTNAYGASKQMVERILGDYDRAYDCARFVCATQRGRRPPARTYRRAA